MTITIVTILGVMGALLGSFGCAQVWRLRAKQLVEDKEEYDQLRRKGEHPKRSEYYDPKELDQLESLLRAAKDDRSECLTCHHRLAWYDLVPLISWVSLRGRCRYCRASIGGAEILAELSLAGVFVVSYLAWPHSLYAVSDVALFVCWLVACLLLLILFIYDAKWSLLPFTINVVLIVIAVIFAGGTSILYGADVWSMLGAVLLLGGLYAVFALFRWSGYGDSILGLGLAILLGKWELAFLTLFLANILGCVALIPIYFRRKLHRGLRVPFGPFMILGALISMLWGAQLIAWFTAVTGGFFMALML